MKITRYLSSRMISRVSALLLAAACTVSANAQQSAQTAIINFSASEELHAENAGRILTDRLHLNNGTDELRSTYTEQPGDGLQVQRFNQYFKGLRVAHGTYTLTSKNGIACYAFGKFYPVAPATTIAPQLKEADALGKALQFTGAQKYMWDTDPATYPKGTLEFVEDFQHGHDDGNVHLAYAFDIYAAEPMSRNMVYIDAQSGDILFTDAIIKNVNASGKSLYSDTLAFKAGKIGSTYYLHDSTRGSGIFTYNLNNGTSASSALNITSTSAFFATDPSIDAHWGAEQVYDYWKNVQNRLSWNGANAKLYNYVHYRNGSGGYNNAFWDGSAGAMNYGDGTGIAGGGFSPLTALDVCAHEIGHGVCQSTAALIYQKESGGMNEGFSDVWGAVIETYANPHESDAVPKDTWLIGEEIAQGALRSMRNPKLYGQPDCYMGTNWVCTSSSCTAGTDNWGVHTNSGVLNYWFYLLTVGGKGTNDLGDQYQIAGIGMTKSAKIVYATELALNSTASYLNCRTASIAAASTVYGACSPEVEAVTRAWFAVGVGSNFTPCTPQVSFAAPTTTVSEEATADGCRPSHIVSIPVVLNGPALSGGNATVAVSAIGGNAVAGVDYDFTPSSAVFTPGGATTQSVALTVYDNGGVNLPKYVDFTYAFTGGSSNASKSGVLDTIRVFITDNDHAPYTGGPAQYEVLSNTATTTTTSPSPFFSSARAARLQYIYKAQELLDAGVKPGAPLTAAEFYVVAKGSTGAFTNFTVQLANTSATSLAGGFIGSGFTQVFNSTLTTTAAWNLMTFTTPFVWNGTDNVAMEICFTNNSYGASNDRVRSQYSSYALGVYASTTSTGSGCTLTFNANNLTGIRPTIRFTQDVPPTPVETAASGTRSWDVKALNETYFYSNPGKKLIAAIMDPATDLGCMTATVSTAGNGFVTASGGSHRSVKEFLVTRTQPDNGAPFDAVFYLTNTELGGVNPDNVRIVQTTSANDFGMVASNTNIISPNEITYGADFTGFRGTFTGTKRFFLTDGNLALGVAGAATAASELWTGGNPFSAAPVLHWNLSASERVSIRLYDVTGKLIYGAEETLAAGTHQMSVSGDAGFAPGTYVLQVVRPSGVFTRQLVKQ